MNETLYRTTSEHRLDSGQSLGVADVMSLLSEFSEDCFPPSDSPKGQPTPTQPPSLSSAPAQERLAWRDPTPTHLEETSTAALAQELWELKLVTLSDSDYYNRQFTRLKRRFWGLTVLAVCAMAGLAGGLGWTATHLKNTQMQVTRLEQGIASQRDRLSELEETQLANLEQQISQLEGQVPDSLVNDLNSTQQELGQLQKEIEQLETDITANDQAVSLLLNFLERMSQRAYSPQTSPTPPENSPPR
ncbi:MAG: hypothetical protein F6K03_10565 [Kamptonema sp. SIO4C4]|nr:hypothetical protein [Kamptonema sp. SIO4C4]